MVTFFGDKFRGGAVQFFGTKRHHDKWLRDTENYVVKGCFAMSELGHGSNVCSGCSNEVFLSCLDFDAFYCEVYFLSICVVFRFEELKQSQHMIQALESLSSTLRVSLLRSTG